MDDVTVSTLPGGRFRPPKPRRRIRKPLLKKKIKLMGAK
jgi:hypothetical protein